LNGAGMVLPDFGPVEIRKCGHEDSASSLISLGASIFEMDGNDADLSTKAFGVYRHFQQRGGTAANSRS
jgi:hypothetical protein